LKKKFVVLFSEKGKVLGWRTQGASRI